MEEGILWREKELLADFSKFLFYGRYKEVFMVVLY